VTAIATGSAEWLCFWRTATADGTADWMRHGESATTTATALPPRRRPTPRNRCAS